MAHDIQTQVIVNGCRNTIIKVNIGIDWKFGNLTDYVIFDQSAYNDTTTSNKLMMIEYCFNDFSAELFWDADTNIPLISLESNIAEDFEYFGNGGLINNAGTGRTGDILITTNNLIIGDTNGHIIFYVKHREFPKTL